MPEDCDGVWTCDGALVGAESWMGHRQVAVTQKEKTKHNGNYNREYESESARDLAVIVAHKRDTEYQMM